MLRISRLVEVFFTFQLLVPSQKLGVGRLTIPTGLRNDFEQIRNYPPILPEVQGLRNWSAREE